MPTPRGYDAHSNPILVGCALRLEVRLLRDRLGDADCDWIATGLGAENTRRALNRRFAERRPRLFIFTGAAGALSDRLTVGEVAFPKSWRREDGPEVTCHAETLRRLRRVGLGASGVGLTLGEPAADAEARRRLQRAFGATVCDMECAAALESAAGFGVPAIAFKVVSDTIDEPVSIKEFKRRLPEVCQPLAARLKLVIRSLRETSRIAAAVKTRNG